VKVRDLTMRIILILCSVLLTACTVGPDYVRPTPVASMPDTYKELQGWKVAQPRDDRLAERWWEIYQDPILNSLVEQVAVSNLNVAAAAAQFRQARALVQAARSGYFPSLTAGASASRVHTSENLGNGPYGGTTASAFQMPLDLTWELDLWGRVRRGVESSQAVAQASAADLAAVTLSIQAELASAYFRLRVLDAQQELLDDTTAIYRKSLELTNYRYEAGAAAKTDTLQAETQLRSTEAQALDIGLQRVQLEHAIALLIGKPPEAFSLPATALAAAIPPIPAGLPSELLERRPDIASAERQVAAANARIGVAKAAYFPTIQLSAAAGYQASQFAEWLTWPSHFWSVGPAMSASLFDGGLRSALSEQARAAYDGTVADYQAAVLTGFQEVEDNLAALRILEEALQVQNQAVQAAQQVVAITKNQYQAGAVTYLNVLVAQAIALANERTVLNLVGRRLTASVLLVKALGGGWQPQESI
jgi:NodT family efflux transporter outer membrane factor (OMF) lipoprotein